MKSSITEQISIRFTADKFKSVEIPLDKEYQKTKLQINAQKVFLPLAILPHMLMDVFPALYQKGAVPLWSVEVCAALCTAVVVFIAVRLYRKLAFVTLVSGAEVRA